MGRRKALLQKREIKSKPCGEGDNLKIGSKSVFRKALGKGEEGERFAQS